MYKLQVQAEHLRSRYTVQFTLSPVLPATAINSSKLSTPNSALIVTLIRFNNQPYQAMPHNIVFIEITENQPVDIA